MSTKKQEAKGLFKDGNKLYEGQLYEEALDHYQRATKLDATFYDAHFCVAKTQIRRQAIEKGVQHFQKHIHLIPEEDRATYSVGLAGILFEEGQHEQAFELVKDRDNAVSGEQLQTYLKILLANGKVNRVLLLLLNLPRERASEIYQQIVNDQSIEEANRKALQQAYAIPEYHEAAQKAALLSNAPAENTTYSEKADGLLRYVQQGKKDFGENFQAYLEALKDKITEVQNLLADCVQNNIDQKNTSRAQTKLSVLEKTDYDPVKIQSLRSSLEAIKKQKRNTYLKYAGVVALVVLVLFGAVWGYGYLSHSQAWSDAKETDTYKAYRGYITEYPEGSNIVEAEKLAEARLWEGIKKDSTEARYEEYLDKYPNGQFSDEARNILNTRFRSRSRNVAASNNQPTKSQRNTVRNARVTGSDVIIRSDHTTESEVAGVIENEGEEVEVLDEYYPTNSTEAILNQDIAIFKNQKQLTLEKGKAVKILSYRGGGIAHISFAHTDFGKMTADIEEEYVEGISGQKWYKVRTSDNTTGWIYGKFIEEL